MLKLRIDLLQPITDLAISPASFAIDEKGEYAPPVRMTQVVKFEGTVHLGLPPKCYELRTQGGNTDLVLNEKGEQVAAFFRDNHFLGLYDIVAVECPFSYPDASIAKLRDLAFENGVQQADLLWTCIAYMLDDQEKAIIQMRLQRYFPCIENEKRIFQKAKELILDYIKQKFPELL